MEAEARTIASGQDKVTHTVLCKLVGTLKVLASVTK